MAMRVVVAVDERAAVGAGTDSNELMHEEAAS